MFITFYPGGGGGGGGGGGTYTPTFTFVGSWVVFGVTDPWFYTTVTVGADTYVTVTGAVTLQPSAPTSSDTMWLTLPIPPAGPWPYPYALAGLGVPGFNPDGGVIEPTSTVQATVGGLTAQATVAAIEADARKMAFTFTYRV